MTQGSLGLCVSRLAGEVGSGRVWSSAVGGGSCFTLCESVHNLHTISSIGVVVKAPPCMHRALLAVIDTDSAAGWSGAQRAHVQVLKGVGMAVESL